MDQFFSTILQFLGKINSISVFVSYFIIFVVNSFRISKSNYKLMKIKEAVNYSHIYQYSPRINISQFKQLSTHRLQEQYNFLEESTKSQSKKPDQNTFIYQIEGNRIKSNVDGDDFAIFCKAPHQWNIEKFWNVCYQEKITKIVALCYRYKYWPDPKQTLDFPEFNLKITSIKEENFSPQLIRRILVVKGKNGDLQVEHFLFTKWKDLGIPQGQNGEKAYQYAVNEMIKAIESKQKLLIHCKAGIGRTGTIAATVQGIRNARHLGLLSIFEIVLNFRLTRPGCVETPKQYSFIHDQILKLL